MRKLAIITVIVVLSFFINLLYYVAWMLMDQWLVEPEGTENSKDLFLTALPEVLKNKV